MQITDRQKYLGDLVLSSAKLDDNIEERYKKGLGIISQIISLLKEISFGNYYFQMAIIFRNALLINSVLLNIEAAYQIKVKHIDCLESLDNILWSKVFQSPSTTASESYFCELNIIPMRFIIITRRLMYYWTILNKETNQLVKQVFNLQSKVQIQNDWIYLVQADLGHLGISMETDEIMSLSKEAFRKIVNVKIRAPCDNYVEQMIKKHSKTKGLTIGLDEIQPYLTSKQLSVKMKQTLFSLRVRSANTKVNYRNKFLSDLSCRYCDSSEQEDYSHLLKCEKLIVTDEMKRESQRVSVQHIFGTLSEQISAAKLWNKIFREISKTSGPSLLI